MAVGRILLICDTAPFDNIAQGEIQSFINLDLDFMRSTAQRAPDPWGTSQPHNAYMETPIAQQMIIGHETRLESGQITTKPIFHESIKNSPKNLVSPDKMITLEIIAHSLPGFNPVYPPLNDFEKYCKDNWGKLPVCDMGYFIFAFLMHVHRLVDQLKPLSLTVQRKLFGHQSTGLVQSYIALLIDSIVWNIGRWRTPRYTAIRYHCWGTRGRWSHHLCCTCALCGECDPTPFIEIIFLIREPRGVSVSATSR